MITVIYDPINGMPIPDGKVDDFTQDVIGMAETNPTITTSSEIVVNCFRAYITEEKLSHTDITFMFEGGVVPFNEYAKISKWPKGLCDTQMGILSRIRGAINIKKRKEKKEAKGWH